jgi:hypothetical protein
MAARSRNNFCHGNPKNRSVHIVDLLVAVNKIKSLNIYMETQQWAPFALLSRYKIFRTASKNTNVCVISGFRRGENSTLVLLECYKA